MSQPTSPSETPPPFVHSPALNQLVKVRARIRISERNKYSCTACCGTFLPFISVPASASFPACGGTPPAPAELLTRAGGSKARRFARLLPWAVQPPSRQGARVARPTGKRSHPIHRKEAHAPPFLPEGGPAPPGSVMADRLTQLQDAVNSVRRPLPFLSATVLLPTREGSCFELVLFLPSRSGLWVASPPQLSGHSGCDPSQGTVVAACR